MAWIGWICWKKILMQLCGLNFCIYYNSSSRFQPSIVKQRNGPKCIQTLQKQTKIQTRLHGMKFSINCSSSAHFAPSFMQYRNGPKCTQTLRNATKVEFRIQWCGSGAFAAKTSNATSWHELLH